MIQESWIWSSGQLWFFLVQDNIKFWYDQFHSAGKWMSNDRTVGVILACNGLASWEEGTYSDSDWDYRDSVTLCSETL